MDNAYTESSTLDFLSPDMNASQVSNNSDILQFVKDIRFYSLGIIIPLGLLGNLVSVFVFITSQLRRKTAGQYFVALALVDNVILIGELCLWMNISAHEGRDVGVEFMRVNDTACQLVHYIRYLVRVWSSLIVMTISIERLVVIISPFNTKRYSTPKKARIIILILLVFSASISSPIFKYVAIRIFGGNQFCYLMMTSSSGNIFRVTGPLCGEFTGPGEFPTQRPVTWSFDVFFDMRLNKRLS